MGIVLKRTIPGYGLVKVIEILDFVTVTDSAKLTYKKVIGNLEIEIVLTDKKSSKEIKVLKFSSELPKTLKEYDLNVYIIDLLSRLQAMGALF
uniref:S1 motif domain-containing protein n=1 Tax=Strongyloides venezuelensis TaxID=75913 RepID=A0A0K0G591_STRVS